MWSEAATKSPSIRPKIPELPTGATRKLCPDSRRHGRRSRSLIDRFARYVCVYKPHPRVYQLAVDRLGVEPQAISFQSSNAWDAWAASAFGLHVVWCNRYGQKPERLPGHPDYEVRSLADLPFLAAH